MNRLHVLLFTWVLFCLLLTVAFWTGTLTKPNEFESLEIENATVAASGKEWLVTMRVRNRGTLESVIKSIDVNGTVIYSETGLSNAEGVVIPVQSDAEVWVKLSNPPYERGTAAIIRITTTKGNNYMEVVILPKFGD